MESNGTVVAGSESGTVAAVETVAMQYEVRQRKGSKGPGTLVAVLGNKADADKVKTDLDAEKSGVETIIREIPVVVPETYESFTEKRKAAVATAAAKAAALSKLSPAEKAALGIK